MFVPAADTGPVVFESAVAEVVDCPEGVAGISSDCAGTTPWLELSWLTSGLLEISRFESDSVV
jgi:hypothetical protein